MVQRTTLANGLSVLTECLTESHSVSLGVWVKTGSRHETAPVSGISHFIEHMLFKGTGRRSAHDIAKEIDSVGGILNGFTSQESSCYYVKALAEKLPLAVDLLGDLLGHSRFDPEEIEKERRVIVQEIAMIEDNPEEYVHDMFIHNFWEGHPLGRPVIGTRQTVGGLNRQQMLAFLGEVCFALARLTKRRARCRGSDFLFFVHQCGAGALPIVTLISTLVGLILAFVGAVQLQMFGAEIYIANLVGIVGGGLVAEYNPRIAVPFSAYFDNMVGALGYREVLQGLLKAMVFGGIIAQVGCYVGFKTRGGARGIGEATTRSVVISFLLIMVANYFLSRFMM